MIVRPHSFHRNNESSSLAFTGLTKPKTTSPSIEKLKSIGGKLEQLEEALNKKKGRKTQNIRFE